MSREKRFTVKHTWWTSLELLVVSLFLVQFQGASIARTLLPEAASDRSLSPDQSPQRQPRRAVEAIQIADEPVYIDRPPLPGAIVVPADSEPLPDQVSDSGASGSDLSEADTPNGSEGISESAEETAPNDGLYASEPNVAEPNYGARAPEAVQRSGARSSPTVRRSQQELLASYQDRIHALVVDKDLKTSLEGSEIRTQAKQDTIATLEQLDSQRKAALLKFLAESYLIDSKTPIISLVGADLSSADLNRVNLSNLDLRDADLRDANLSRANLSGTKLFRAALNRSDLSFANLSSAEFFKASLGEAKLFFANLSNANFNSADLKGSDLSLANLTGSDFSNADLSSTDLSFANLSTAELIGADLGSTDLSFASLKGTNLKGSDLSGANLRNADLNGADLSGANLSGADLTGAKLNGANLFGVDLESATLSNTTLPDGTVQK